VIVRAAVAPLLILSRLGSKSSQLMRAMELRQEARKPKTVEHILSAA
jgi:hypothetical protein